jgi:hypothetical protein
MRDNNLNISDLNLLLDSAEAALRNDDYELFGFIALHELPAFRACGSADIWKNEYIPAIRAHPVYELALQCPFCQRATDKPRGYAGDAVLIDYLYQHEPTISCLEATPAGLGMLNYWATSPAGAAVKYRKNLFRRKISSLPAGARVVSIACG